MILSLYFLVQAFEAAYYNRKYSEALQANYLKTYTKYDVDFKKFVKKYTKNKDIKLPEPELFNTYKSKIAYGIAYLYMVGGLCIAVKVKLGNLLLIPVHIIVSTLMHNPYLAERDTEF